MPDEPIDSTDLQRQQGLPKTSQPGAAVVTTERVEPKIADTQSTQGRPAESILTPAPTQAAEEITSLPKFSKKGFPKLAIFILVGVFLLGILAFFLSKLASSNKGLVGKKGEIVWWGTQEEESAAGSLIAEYQKDNPQVSVKYVKQSTQDYRERLANALANGTGPDIFEIHNSWTPMFKSVLAVMPDSVMSQAEFTRTFYPVIVSDLTTKEGVIGIPLFFDAITLYVNEDIFASAAKSPPKTWNELRDLALALTPPKDANGTIIQSGVALGRTENVDYWPEILGLMMLQNKVNLAVPTGKFAEDAVAFFTFFSGQAAVWDEKLPASTVAFGQGKVAMYFGPSRRAPEIIKASSNLRFRTVSLPQLAKETPEEPDVSYATYWVQAVSERSVNKDAAWHFLKFLTSRDSLEKLNSETIVLRKAGRSYSRIDMASLQSDDPIVGSIIALAPYAKSWYLDSDTYDGATGLNTQINTLFAGALLPGANPKAQLEETAKGVSKILSQYGILAN